MKSVKYAVIPAAGLGTRFLPATKTIPKEMLPIVDKPILLYNVEEIVQSGIETIVIIAGRGKTAIEDFFDTSYELEQTLEKTNQLVQLERLHQIKKMCQIVSVRQKEARGLGHAVLCAEAVVGDNPFAVLLGDELMIHEPKTPSATEQLCSLFTRSEKSAVALMPVHKSEVHKYGIVDAKETDKNIFEISSVVEKPSADSAPSMLALPGRYVFQPVIFEYLKKIKPGKNFEIQLTDAMTMLAQNEGLIGTQVQARRYDAGSQLGYLQANIELALERPELKIELTNYLTQLGERLK